MFLKIKGYNIIFSKKKYFGTNLIYDNENNNYIQNVVSNKT